MIDLAESDLSQKDEDWELQTNFHWTDRHMEMDICISWAPDGAKKDRRSTTNINQYMVVVVVVVVIHKTGDQEDN